MDLPLNPTLSPDRYNQGSVMVAVALPLQAYLHDPEFRSTERENVVESLARSASRDVHGTYSLSGDSVRGFRTAVQS